MTHVLCLLAFLDIIIYLSVFVLHSWSLSFPPLPLLIYSLWHTHNVSSFSFTLHPTVHPSIPAAPPYSSASPSSSSLWLHSYHWFIRNPGVSLWVITQKLTRACKFKLPHPLLFFFFFLPLYGSLRLALRMLHPCVPSEPTLSCWSTEVES